MGQTFQCPLRTPLNLSQKHLPQVYREGNRQVYVTPGKSFQSIAFSSKAWRRLWTSGRLSLVYSGDYIYTVAAPADNSCLKRRQFSRQCGRGFINNVISLTCWLLLYRGSTRHIANISRNYRTNFRRFSTPADGRSQQWGLVQYLLL